MTFTDLEYAGRKRSGKREKFLDSMDRIIPWADFIKKIEPYYPKSGRPGRPPRGIEPMLRMYFLQVSELQQRRRVRRPFLIIIQPHKSPHRVTVVYRLFRRFVRRIEPYLQKIHPQHRLDAALHRHILNR